jgi:hypothetical protein
VLTRVTSSITAIQSLVRPRIRHHPRGQRYRAARCDVGCLSSTSLVPSVPC